MIEWVFLYCILGNGSEYRTTSFGCSTAVEAIFATERECRAYQAAYVELAGEPQADGYHVCYREISLQAADAPRQVVAP